MEISEIRKSISLMKAVIISDRVHDQLWRDGAGTAERQIDRTLALVARMVRDEQAVLLKLVREEALE
jgi:hypothetical protein